MRLHLLFLFMFQYFLKLSVYTLCLTASIILAYTLKYNFVVPAYMQRIMWVNVYTMVPIKIFALIVLGEFKGIFSYFRLPDLIKIVLCFLGITTAFFLAQAFSSHSFLPSREILLADLLFSILFILFFRAGIRIIQSRYNLPGKSIELTKERPGTLRVAIIGANDTGSQVVAELKSKGFHRLKPVLLLDDDPKYYGRTLHGVPVVGAPESLREFKASYAIEGLILISQGIAPKRTQELLTISKELDLKVYTIPSISDFITGRVHTTRLRTLDFEDFLERKPIKLHFNQITKLVQDKVVAVTGAGGSIGSELSRQLAHAKPKQLLLIDHSEYNLFQIEQGLLNEELSGTPILVDITNRASLQRCFSQFKPDIIYHAAAYKHVPLLENQPLVALNNNGFGTGQLALLASEMGVERFVLVSTDKAIDPINNMGASKRIAELFCQAVQKMPGNRTQFMAVRFGNVLGSAGSVLPIFKQQIARGGPITVTHPETTRYFMTIPEAVGLILEASTFDSVGGKIFVLDMGKPVKILDVAKKVIELNNLQLGVDIDIVFTGLRPGEKLHEDLEYDPNKMSKTSNEHIWLFKDNFEWPSTADDLKQCLFESVSSNESSIAFIQKLIPAFKKANLLY